MPWRHMVLLVVATLAAWVLVPRHDLQVDLVFSSEAAGPGEVFHAAAGEDFSPGRSVSFATANDASISTYVVDLDAHAPVARLRLDLATAPGAVDLRSVSLRGKVMGLETGSVPLALEPAALQHVGGLERVDGGLRFQSLGNDPYVEIAVPAAAAAELSRGVSRLRLLAAVLLGLVAAALYPGYRWLRRASHAAGGAGAWSHRRLAVLAPLARACSDPGTIVFTPSTIAIVLLAACMAAAGVTARIHQSSVGIWSNYLPSAQGTDATLVGTPRQVRADEWLVLTPWMMSQAARGFPLENRALGGDRSPLLTSVPLAHPVAQLQPEFWGFAMFDVERAVSWYWMYKLFGLLVSAFLLLLLLTRGDGFLSACGAVWICFSSYTQWWYSTSLPELLVGFFLTLVGFHYVCLATRRRTFLFGIVALLLGAATFAFQMYPPFQIPLAYLALAIVAGLFGQRENRVRFLERGGLRIAALAACAAVLAFLLYRFAVDAAGTITTMTNTAYPGQRFSVGGTMPWFMALDGLFEGWRIGETSFPYTNSNASESSDYVVLLPLVVAAMALGAARQLRRDSMLVALAAFGTLLLGWMVVTLPTPVAETISRIFLLKFVPPPRATLAVGIASILLATVWMARASALGAWPAARTRWVFVAAAALATYHYGAVMHGIDPAFFGGRRIVLGSAVAALAAYALVTGNRRAFGAFVLLVALPGLTVNPVARGLGPLLDSRPLAAAVAANGTGDHRWIVVGNFVMPQAFKAAGLDVLGGATYVPDAATFAALDPGRRHEQTWNRYAHIQVESDSTLAAPDFVLVQDDLYRLRLNVCSPAVAAVGVDRVAYHGDVPAADLACLKPIGAPVGGFSLYARVPATR